MKSSDSLANISASLSAAQAKFKHVAYDSKGYGYSYASLSAVIDATLPILNKEGIAVVQSVSGTDGSVAITTRLIHSSGEWLEDTFSMLIEGMKGMNNWQAAGSGISYLRRYSLSAMLCISSMEDTDAAGETKPVDKPAPKATPKATPKPSKPVEKEPYPSTAVKCLKCSTEAYLDDMDAWEKVGHSESTGILWAKCKCGAEAFKVWGEA